MRREHLNDAVEDAFHRRDFRAVLDLIDAALPELRAQGEMSDEFLIALENKARAHFNLNEQAASLEAESELLELDGRKNGFVNDNYVRDLGNVAYGQVLLGRWDEAEANLKRAFELVRQLPEAAQWLHGSLLTYQARLFFQRGDLRRAERTYLEAAAVRRLYWPPDTPPLADVYVSLCRLYTHAGRAEAATRVLQKAIRIYRLYLPESVERVNELTAYLQRLTSPANTPSST